MNSPDKIRFDSRINMHIANRQIETKRSPARPRLPKDRKALDDSIRAAYSRMQPVSILILGHVGVGKSLFLTYTRRISAKSFFDGTLIRAAQWIPINFLECPRDQGPSDFIYERALD